MACDCILHAILAIAGIFVESRFAKLRFVRFIVISILVPR